MALSHSEVLARLRAEIERWQQMYPGPWHTHKHVENLVSVGSSDGMVASVARWSHGIADPTSNDANARGIAASRTLTPLLLKMAVEVAERHIPNDPEACESAECVLDWHVACDQCSALWPCLDFAAVAAVAESIQPVESKEEA